MLTAEIRCYTYLQEPEQLKERPPTGNRSGKIPFCEPNQAKLRQATVQAGCSGSILAHRAGGGKLLNQFEKKLIFKFWEIATITNLNFREIEKILFFPLENVKLFIDTRQPGTIDCFIPKPNHRGKILIYHLDSQVCIKFEVVDPLSIYK